ncbi:MAG: S8 family serine peptidase [Candidatus Eremiobacterota bacterium]
MLGSFPGIPPELVQQLRRGQPQPPRTPPPTSGLAEPKEPDATIAVFDNFVGAQNGTTHGEEVEAVLMQTGGFQDEDIQRFQASSGGSKQGMRNATTPEQFGDELNRYIVDTQAGMLDSTSDNLAKILSDPNSKIKTINQSNSQSEAKVAENLYQEANNNPQFRARLEQELGLPPGASKREFLQALVNRVDQVSEKSPELKQERARYEKLSAEADRRGITHVVTPGNLGDFARHLEKQGVKVDDDFYRSVLTNEHTLTVGASDDRGTATSRDDRPAHFTTPDAGVEVSTNGTNVRMTVDGQQRSQNGTSFAAPQVAAVAAQMKEANPNLTDEQIEAILKQSATPVPGTEARLGEGNIQPDVAVTLAFLSGRPLG